MRITVKVESDPVLKTLKDLQDKCEDTSPLMQMLGAMLESSTMLRFHDSEAPSGQQWDQLSDVTLARRRKKGKDAKPLRDTDVLMNSITYNYGNGWVEVGSPEPYASTHQFGAGKGEFGTGYYKTKKGSFPIPWGDVPARPFLGMSNEDETDIMDILQHYLNIL